ncbi:MAG TPA: hypothetical protein VFY39_02855 [Gammaproteobacteria bacterium]|nr:hypothetical protein [Gammaproteobacteria bacterium]
MNERLFGAGVVAAGTAIAALAVSLPAAAQTKEAGWTQPMTPWGAPDIQGMWPIGNWAGVPLVRPKKYGDSMYITDDEYAQRVKRDEALAERYAKENKQNKIGMGHWDESGDAQRRNSFIIIPRDGSFPELTPYAIEKSKTMGSSWFRKAWDRPTDFDTWDRCITRGLPASMFPMHYNNGVQIVQSPGYVVIRLEMIHESRIIPIDSKPLDPAIEQWMGASRGHWERNTLVIDTTNFNGIPAMTNIGTVGSPRMSIPESTKTHITERLTRISDNQMQYSITVEDPVDIKEPWTAAYTWTRDPSYKMYEYACLEGDEQVRNYIVTSRYARAHPEKTAATRERRGPRPQED